MYVRTEHSFCCCHSALVIMSKATANNANASQQDIKLAVISELHFKLLDHGYHPNCFQRTHFELNIKYNFQQRALAMLEILILQPIMLQKITFKI